MRVLDWLVVVPLLAAIAVGVSSLVFAAWALTGRTGQRGTADAALETDGGPAMAVSGLAPTPKRPGPDDPEPAASIACCGTLYLGATGTDRCDHCGQYLARPRGGGLR